MPLHLSPSPYHPHPQKIKSVVAQALPPTAEQDSPVIGSFRSSGEIGQHQLVQSSTRNKSYASPSSFAITGLGSRARTAANRIGRPLGVTGFETRLTVADFAHCPDCGDPLSVHGVCGSCGYGLKGKRKTAKQDPEAARRAELAVMAKQRYLDSAPTSADLTDQQWYNVCKFWPWVAMHCKRERFKVGPDHPLDATSRRGPLLTGQLPVFRRGDDPDALEERAAIQTE